MTDTIETIADAVIAWGRQKNITGASNAARQWLKCSEEFGEIAAALARGDQEGFKDAIGDTIVTLILLCEIRGTDIADCLALAWDEIKDRQGATVDGVFIKHGEQP